MYIYLDTETTGSGPDEVNLDGASLSDCTVYGISAWNLNLRDTDQANLVITSPGEPTITVDNIEVGQFIYLLLNNQKVRDVINTITSKAVLILGRFTQERKAVLDALRIKLRELNYLPILFDFDRPSSRNLTETISTLAHIAKFVIADITGASSIPQELQRIIPNLPSLPIQPLLLSTETEYGMFADLLDYPWVLEPFSYDSLEMLLDSVNGKVIGPGTILHGTILVKAKFIDTTLHKASLNKANFSRASMFFTMIADVDLRNAIGLDNVDHRGPSSIGIDTIYNSQGEIVVKEQQP